MNEMLEEIEASIDDEQVFKANGYDEAIIGIDYDSMRLVYSVKKCLDILMEQGMEYSEAMEYFEFNVSGTKSSTENFPIWCHDDFGIEPPTRYQRFKRWLKSFFS